MLDLEEREVDLGMRRLVFIARRCIARDIVPKIFIPWNLCVMCGYMWDSTPGVVPHKCPSCKSTRWKESDLHIFRCTGCNHEWVSKSARPIRCPSCRTKAWDRCPESGVDACVLPSEVRDILRTVGDYKACIAHLMNDAGLDKDDADVLYHSNQGMDMVSIARRTKVSYDRVFDLVSALNAACPTMKAARSKG